MVLSDLESFSAAAFIGAISRWLLKLFHPGSVITSLRNNIQKVGLRTYQIWMQK